MDPKVEEKKVEAPPQAPAQAAPDQQAVEAPKPSGLDALTKEQLQELYKKTPQLFEEAGIVKKQEAPPEEKKVEEPPKPQSAAPVVYAGKEIKLPEDVPVDLEAVKVYFEHAKEVGLSPEQVQKQVDFQTKQARDAMKRQQVQPPTQAEVDAANVARLKADKDFGAKYDENMEVARKAAVKFGDPELLDRLRTSDPVLVKHLWKLGRADAEDKTPGAPNRTGEEMQDEEKSKNEQNKQRYPNTPQMFTE